MTYIWGSRVTYSGPFFKIAATHSHAEFSPPARSDRGLQREARAADHLVMTTSGTTDLGNVQLTVKPGESLPITYSPGPVMGNNVTKVYGAYSGRFEILSNDPTSFHTFLEMRGTVR